VALSTPRETERKPNAFSLVLNAEIALSPYGLKAITAHLGNFVGLTMPYDLEMEGKKRHKVLLSL
jgi:hypothetical protein